MIASFLVNLAGTLLFLFIFWKRLKEDYAPDLIFRTAFLTLFGLATGALIASKFAPSTFFWSEFCFGVIFLGIGIYRFNLRLFEALETFVVSILPWVSLTFLKGSVFSQSLVSFVAFIVTLLVISLSFYLDTHYKGFSWYRSGRVGLVGQLSLLAIFLIRMTTSFFKSDVLSFVKYEGIFSGVGAFVCVLLTVYLARSEQ